MPETINFGTDDLNAGSFNGAHTGTFSGTHSGSGAALTNVPNYWPVLTGEVGVLNTRYQPGDILRYGLTGFGDETTALTSAITSAAAIGGVAVVLPANFTVFARVTSAPSYVLIRGAGKDSSTLKLPAGANAHLVTVAANAQLVRFKDLTLDGNAGAQAAGNWYGISSPGVTDRLRLERVRITNTKSHAVRSEGTLAGAYTTNFRARDCDFDEIGGYGVILNERHAAPRFIDCTFSNWGKVTAASDAIALWSTNASAHLKVKILDNDFIASSSNLFAIESVTPAVLSLKITGNTFDGSFCGVSVAANGGQFNFNDFLAGVGTHRSGFELFVTNSVVSGNTIANGTIALSPSSVWGIPGTNTVVTYNVVRNQSLNGKGIAVGGSFASSRIKITKNIVDMSGATGSFEAIMLGVYGTTPQTLTDISVVDNDMFATNTSGNAIRLTGLAGSSGFKITDNRATGFGVGLTIGSSSGAGHTEVTAHDNDFRGCTTAYQNTDTTGGVFRINDNIHANGGLPYGVETPNDAGWFDGQLSELITLSLAGTTSDSVANLLPQYSIIHSVVARVITTITGATDWKIGDTVQAARFTGAQVALAAGNVAQGLNQWDPTVASSNLGPATSGAATKLRITTTGTPTAGAIRVTVFYRQFRVPQS